MPTLPACPVDDCTSGEPVHPVFVVGDVQSGRCRRPVAVCAPCWIRTGMGGPVVIERLPWPTTRRTRVQVRVRIGKAALA